MDPSGEQSFEPLLVALLNRSDLPAAAVTGAVRAIMTGRVPDAVAAAFLTALRCKGETGEEIAAAALVLRERMIRLVPVRAPVLDTCGTGGDGTGTFNISTAAAFVVAAAGVPVVKHGGRAVSSRSGSADVLRELGVDIDSGPEWSQRCLDRFGFAFCYAPHFHDGLKTVAALRRSLGFRTLFNLIGPLANPATADFQLLGVGDAKLLDPYAAALARLSVRRAVVVHGRDGLDEISLDAPTDVRIVEGDEFRVETWQPAQFDLAPVSINEIRSDSAVESAKTILSVLGNDDTAARRIVLANAAAALWTAEAAATLREGVALAEEAIRSGKAMKVLEQLRG